MNKLMHEEWLEKVCQLAVKNVEDNGGPFAAAIVKDGKLVSIGCNGVTRSKDPTAHAEVTAIRNACVELGTHDLKGCVLYTSCEPCPMCLSAALWARIDSIYFAATRQDAANAGFDDSFFYEQVALPVGQRSIQEMQIDVSSKVESFEVWKSNATKIEY